MPGIYNYAGLGNGFPFCTPAATIWDGTTYYGGHPSASSSSLQLVFGDGTYSPLGPFTLQEAMRLFYCVKRIKCDLSIDGEDADGHEFSATLLFHFPAQGYLDVSGAADSATATLDDWVGAPGEKKLVCPPDLRGFGFHQEDIKAFLASPPDTANYAGSDYAINCAVDGDYWGHLLSRLYSSGPIVRSNGDYYFPLSFELAVYYSDVVLILYSWRGHPSYEEAASFTMLGKTIPLFSLYSDALSNLDLTIDIDTEGPNYWPYDPDDGGGPIYDTATGDQLRDPFVIQSPP